MQEKIYNEIASVFKKVKGEELSYEDLQEFEYLTLVVKESLRIDPPVHYTTPIEALKEVKVGNITMRPGDMVTCHLYGIHRDPREWQQPEEFIPERFDPDSKFFKTPSGKKRNPMSFIPFIAG
jgi:cytochrome P450